MVLSGCTSDGLEAPTDGGDPVAYCSLAASIVGQADLNEALTEMVAVAAPTVADATKSAAEGDRGEHARAVEAYVLDECGVVLDLGQ